MKRLRIILATIAVLIMPFMASAQTHLFNGQLFAGYTPTEVNSLFAEYGYAPSEADIGWWGQNRENTLGNLRENLARRQTQHLINIGVIEPELTFNDFIDGELGSTFLPTDFSTILSQSLSEGGSETTLNVSTVTTKDSHVLTMSDIGTKGFLHINPGRDNQEIISFTDISGTQLTGLERGYNFYNTATSTARVQAHSPGEIAIVTNDFHYYRENFLTLREDADISGNLLFATTTPGSITRIFLGNRDTYFWTSTSTGQFGFATSTSGELAFNTNGTTFNSITPLSLNAGELKLATSTYDFSLDVDSLLRLASTTVGSIISGTATGTRFDDGWNDRYQATTTKPLDFTFSDDLTITGNTTSTGSLDVGSFCFDGTNCVTEQFVTTNYSTSSDKLYTTGGADEIAPFATTTIYGLGANDVIDYQLFFESLTSTSGDTRVSVKFGESTTSNTLISSVGQEFSIFGKIILHGITKQTVSSLVYIDNSLDSTSDNYSTTTEAIGGAIGISVRVGEGGEKDFEFGSFVVKVSKSWKED